MCGIRVIGRKPRRYPLLVFPFSVAKSSITLPDLLLASKAKQWSAFLAAPSHLSGLFPRIIQSEAKPAAFVNSALVRAAELASARSPKRRRTQWLVSCQLSTRLGNMCNSAPWWINQKARSGSPFGARTSTRHSFQTPLMTVQNGCIFRLSDVNWISLSPNENLDVTISKLIANNSMNQNDGCRVFATTSDNLPLIDN